MNIDRILIDIILEISDSPLLTLDQKIDKLHFLKINVDEKLDSLMAIRRNKIEQAKPKFKAGSG